MQRSLVLALLGFLLAAPALMAQEGTNHVEVGAFVDYFNLSRTSPHINFVGVGGRAAFNVRSNVQIEAEMAYDFKRNFTTTFSDGINTQFVDTRLRTLHALFGPKFGTSGGPVRLYGTFKAGLINFSVSGQNAGSGFPERHWRCHHRQHGGCDLSRSWFRGLYRTDRIARRGGRRNLLQERLA